MADEGTTELYVCVQREEEFVLRPSIIIKTWRIGVRFRTLFYSQMTATYNSGDVQFISSWKKTRRGSICTYHLLEEKIYNRRDCTYHLLEESMVALCVPSPLNGRWTAGAWRRRRGEASRAAAAAAESGGGWERGRLREAADESGVAGGGWEPRRRRWRGLG
jgi:hypothetical protein